LLSRYWLITDGNGKTSEVRGDGVVGKQPTIQPGENFIYTSGAVIETPVGTMQGYYQMQHADGSLAHAAIDVFSLRVPNAIN
jgi:ApaG protein